MPRRGGREFFLVEDAFGFGALGVFWLFCVLGFRLVFKSSFVSGLNLRGPFSGVCFPLEFGKVSQSAEQNKQQMNIPRAPNTF